MRETISDIVTRAGFPPVILSPVNFEALFNESKQKKPWETGQISL